MSFVQAVDHKVVNEGIDTAQLDSMAVDAKEALQVEHLEVLAAKGYYISEEIGRCMDEGIVPYIQGEYASRSVPHPWTRECTLRNEPDNASI